MNFGTPWLLLLLLAVPFIIWLGRPSRGPSRRRDEAIRERLRRQIGVRRHRRKAQ